MDKYKYQALALLIAILIGGLLGGFITTNNKNKEIVKLAEKHKIELTKEIAASKQHITEIDQILIQKQVQAKRDSNLIVNLQKEVVKNKIKTVQKQEEVAKLSLTDKAKWLISRYDSVPKLPQLSIALPELVVDSIANELVIKDGLVIEINAKDSIITVYDQALITEKSKVRLLTIKGQEYEKVIADKDKLYEYVQAELKDKKKENVKLKVKNVLLGVGIAVETVILILLIK